MNDSAFFAAATEVVNDIEREIKRLPATARANCRGLEFGCGSGRLLRPMSRHFSELWGCDAAGLHAEASEILNGISNAKLAELRDGKMPEVPSESIDFIYSWTRFGEPIGSGVLLDAFQEIWRVLKSNGLARLQFNASPNAASRGEGSAASRYSSRELLELAERHHFQVLSLESGANQAVWTTWRKREEGWSATSDQQFPQFASDSSTPAGATMPVTIRAITNGSSTEPVAPCRGRFASIAIWVENLPEDAGLNHLRVTVGSSFGTVTSIGPRDALGAQCVRVDLPEIEATGLLAVQLLWLEEPISPPATLRVIPPGPMVPRILSLGDRDNPLARGRIESRAVKVSLEEITRPYDLEAFVGGLPAPGLEYFCTGPREQRYDISFYVPDEVGPGKHGIEIKVGHRRLPAIPVEIVN